MSFDVAVVGAPFLDVTFEGLPRLPRVGEETVARALHLTPGGTGMQAIAAARLGLAAALVAPLGAGAAARLLTDVFEAEGVRLVRAEGVGGADPGGRPGAAGLPVTALLATPEGVAMATALGSAEPGPRDVSEIAARAALVSLGRLALTPPGAAVYAVTGGLELTAVDASTLRRLSGARALVLNASEAAAITDRDHAEESARELARHVGAAVVTLGPGGALACEGEEIARARAPEVEVADATGAGDLFAAAYVWADLRGASLRDRLVWASLYAGLSVRAPTALAGALTVEQLVSEGRARGLAPPPELTNVIRR